MGTRMKGIYKGFKYTLSQIFVMKAEEREMEIGHPTDVKHLAHIGWDGGPSGNAAPSWMNEFKTGPDFAATSINGNSFSGPYPWSSQEFSESMRQSSEQSEMFKDAAAVAVAELPNVKKKQKRKLKSKSTSYVSSSLWSSSQAAKSKSNFMEGGAKTTDIQVS